MLGDVQDDGENDFFIDFTIAYNSEWTKSEGKRGSVENVTIKNVNVYKMVKVKIVQLKTSLFQTSLSKVKKLITILT